MDSRRKKKALTGLGSGLPLFVGGWTLLLLSRRTGLTVVGIVMMLIALPLYLWGCAELAKAKGYSTAIVLTFILGGLFPLVILLALPDKNRHRHW